tara:strand:- start:377 stop:643 length:267 start_codon:yes stop_codon:yes gene_type:complete
LRLNKIDEQSKYGTLSIIIAIIAIILSWNKEFFVAAITGGFIAIAFAYLSRYIKQIKENAKRLSKLERDLEIDKRLIRLEELNKLKRR